MTMQEMIKTVTPKYVAKLDDSKLKRLNGQLHLANTLARITTRPLIEKVQKFVHTEMYNRGFDGIVKPKNTNVGAFNKKEQLNAITFEIFDNQQEEEKVN